MLRLSHASSQASAPILLATLHFEMAARRFRGDSDPHSPHWPSAATDQVTLASALHALGVSRDLRQLPCRLHRDTGSCTPDRVYAVAAAPSDNTAPVLERWGDRAPLRPRVRKLEASVTSTTLNPSIPGLSRMQLRMAPASRVDILATWRIWRTAPTSTARVGTSPADRRRTRGNEVAISSIQHTKWHTGHGERWGIKRIDRASRVLGPLAQLVEQWTFNPQQEAPTQGLFNPFAAARSQRWPQNALE